jgi:hypothetical protein
MRPRGWPRCVYVPVGPCQACIGPARRAGVARGMCAHTNQPAQ